LKLGEEMVLAFNSSDLVSTFDPNGLWVSSHYKDGAQAGKGWFFQRKEQNTSSSPEESIDTYASSIANKFVFEMSPFVFGNHNDDTFYGLHIIVPDKKLELFSWLSARGHSLADVTLLRNHCRIRQLNSDPQVRLDSPVYDSEADKQITKMCVAERKQTREKAIEVFKKCRIELYSSISKLLPSMIPGDIQILIVHNLIGDLS
jgi:hypothetical protein